MTNYLDIKVLLSCLFFYIFQEIQMTFSESEIIMKVIVFFLTVGYTARRWYLLEKNKSE